MDFSEMCEDEIQTFHESPLSALFPRLRGGTFHRLSLDRYRIVMQDGYLRPNVGGFEPTTVKSIYSFGGKRGYISVFDFAAVTDRQFAIQEGHHGSGWGGFFTNYEPFTVVLELDRELLIPKLISNLRYHPDPEMFKNEFFMWHVEAWYPEPIPTSLIKSRLLITPSPNYPAPVFFEEVKANEDFEAAVSRLTKQWESVPPRRTYSMFDGMTREQLEEMVAKVRQQGLIPPEE